MNGNICRIRHAQDHLYSLVCVCEGGGGGERGGGEGCFANEAFWLGGDRKRTGGILYNKIGLSLVIFLSKTRQDQDEDMDKTFISTALSAISLALKF